MQDLMHKDVTFRAKILFAFGASIAAIATESICRYSIADGRRPDQGKRRSTSIATQGGAFVRMQDFTAEGKICRDKQTLHDLHRFVRLHWEEVVITPGKMGRTYDHQVTNWTIGRNVAHFGKTAWAKVTFAFHIPVAGTKCRG